MTPLSTQAKEAIKVALAMVIAYYVALRFELFNPTWVATTVAFISLPSEGQSLRQAALRISGTLVAFVVGLLYLALFPQARWLFLVSFSPYLFLVAYMVQNRKRAYFWFVAGFVTMMITTAGPGSSEHAFHFAAYRAMETALGIVVWAGVSVFLWPQTNIGALTKSARELTATQRRLLGVARERLLGREQDADVGAERAAEAQLVTKLQETITAAASESYEIREVRPLWYRFHSHSEGIMSAFGRLSTGREDRQGIALDRVIPDLAEALTELDARLAEADRLLGGEAPQHQPEAVSFTLAEAELSELDHFQQAAVEMARVELERLDALTRDLVTTLRDLKGFEPGLTPAELDVPASTPPSRGWLRLPPPDPDRIRGAVMVVASMWLGFLLWIYVNPPGHVSWYQFVPNLTLVAVQAPFLRMALLRPFALAYVVGLAVYVLLMPQLSSFWQLAPLLFAFSFVAAYWFPGLGRVALFLAVFNMLGISNEQVYDFAKAANSFTFTMLALLVVLAMSYLLRSPRPEKAFLALVRRYFQSCEYLLGALGDPEPARSFSGRLRWAFHRQEIRLLPRKLGMWGRSITPRQFPGTDPDRVAGLIAGFQTLTVRIEELIDARMAPHADRIVRELGGDLRKWRLVFQEGFARWADEADVHDPGQLRRQLANRLQILNERIHQVLNSPTAGDALTETESRSFYRILGCFRGLSNAAISLADHSRGICWEEWREERFS